MYRRKTVLSDSRGKAPVVSFMFEPKVSCQEHTHNVYNTLLTNNTAEYLYNYEYHMYDGAIIAGDSVNGCKRSAPECRTVCTLSLTLQLSNVICDELAC
jgi:hypothetical protein